MKEIVCTLLTSEGCGHCSHFRGNGILGNKKQFNTYDFLNKHLKPNGITNDITFLNIHFGSMNGSHSQIAGISKYTRIKKNAIQQELYYLDQHTTVVSVTGIDSSEKAKIITKQQVVKINNNKISWSDFLDEKIPKNIEKYTFFYPCFIVFEKQDWVKKGNILGLPNAGIVIRNSQGDYEIDKNGQTIQQRNVPSQQLITGAVTEQIKFVAEVDHYKPKEEKVEEIKEEKVEEKVEEIKEEIKEEKPKKQTNFIIKGYDDY